MRAILLPAILTLMLAAFGAGQAVHAAAPPSPPSAAIWGGSSSISAGTSSSNVALPAATSTFPVIEVINDSTTPAWVLVGTGAGVTATQTSLYVPAGQSRAFWALGDHLAAITSTGTAVLHIQQWNGAPSGQ